MEQQKGNYKIFQSILSENRRGERQPKTLPDPLSFLRRFSVMSFSPFIRKTTIPRWRSTGTSKRSSEMTICSNFWARETPWSFQNKHLIFNFLYSNHFSNFWTKDTPWSFQINILFLSFNPTPYSQTSELWNTVKFSSFN